MKPMRIASAAILLILSLLFDPAFAVSPPASLIRLPDLTGVSVNRTLVIELPAGVDPSWVEGVVLEAGGQFLEVSVQVHKGKLLIAPEVPFERSTRYAVRVFLADGGTIEQRFETEQYPLVNLDLGQLIQVRARPEQGFNYDYFLYLPRGIDRSGPVRILVEPNNTYLADQPEVHVERALDSLGPGRTGRRVADELRIPLLMPAFVRPFTNNDLYTHNLNLKTMLLREGPMARIDLQLLAMIDDAREILAYNMQPTEEKVFMIGYSASGSFVNKFALMHPERVRALTTGGTNAIPTFPLAQINGIELRYPLGIADLEEISGKSFDPKAYSQVAQFFYMGEIDNNDSLHAWDIFSSEDTDTILKFLPERMMPDRWEKTQEILRSAGFQIQTATYPAQGHDWAPVADLAAFYRANDAESPSLVPIIPLSNVLSPPR